MCKQNDYAKKICIYHFIFYVSRSNQEEARYSAIDLDAKLQLEGYNVTNVTIPEVDTHFNISVFSGLIGAVFFFGLIRALMFFKVRII